MSERHRIGELIGLALMALSAVGVIGVVALAIDQSHGGQQSRWVRVYEPTPGMKCWRQVAAPDGSAERWHANSDISEDGAECYRLIYQTEHMHIPQ